MESFEYAEEDIRARQLLEARNEAESILRATVRALGEYGREAISDEEIGVIDAAASELETACKGQDHAIIREKIEALNEVTMPLAERLMDNVLKAELRNKSVSEALKD